jgi:hypothetical protein
MLRACCNIHSVSGLLVQAKYSMRRLPIEEENEHWRRGGGSRRRSGRQRSRGAASCNRSRQQLVDGVRGLGRRAANPRAFARDVGRRRHLLRNRTRGPLFKPVAPTASVPLTPAGELLWEPGQVTVCCTTDDDVHAVAAVGTEPTVGSTSTAATSAGSGAGRTTPPPAKPAGSCLAGTAQGSTPQLRTTRG